MLKRFLAILWGVLWCGAESRAVDMSPKGLINTVHKQIHQHHHFHFLLPLSLSIPLLFSSFVPSCISYSWVQGNNSVQHIQREHPPSTSSSISISFQSALLLTDPFGNSSSKKKKKRTKEKSTSIILQFQQSCLEVGQRVLSVSVKEPVSRWGAMRRRAAGSRRSLNVSCEGGGRSPSTAGGRRTGPPYGRPDSGG